MVFPETVNERGNGAQLDLSTGNLDVFGVGLIYDHGYQKMNWKEFAPRLGVAYQLTQKRFYAPGMDGRIVSERLDRLSVIT